MQCEGNYLMNCFRSKNYRVTDAMRGWELEEDEKAMTRAASMALRYTATTIPDVTQVMPRRSRAATCWQNQATIAKPATTACNHRHIIMIAFNHYHTIRLSPTLTLLSGLASEASVSALQEDELFVILPLRPLYLYDHFFAHIWLIFVE